VARREMVPAPSWELIEERRDEAEEMPDWSGMEMRFQPTERETGEVMVGA
jgi:hypothetical protein